VDAAAAVTRGSEVKRSARGSTLVEGALVLSGVLMLLIAVIDAGQFLFVRHALADRARAAARWAALNLPAETPANGELVDSGAVFNMVLYGVPEGAARGRQPGLGMDNAVVQVRRLGAGTADDRIVLTVSGYRAGVVLPLLGAAMNPPPLVVVEPLT
jgi:hypothetical protein